MKKLPKYIGTFPTWENLQSVLHILRTKYDYNLITVLDNYRTAHIHGPNPRTSLRLMNCRIEGASYCSSHMTFKEFKQKFSHKSILFKAIHSAQL